MESIDVLQFELMYPAFVFISVLMVLGIPGNIVSILVYGLQLKSTTGRYAIITLAVCDVINCVMSIPVEMYIMTRYWSFDNAALCKMSRFVTHAMNNSSGLILVAIAFERYRTICTPHKPKIQTHYIKIACVAIVICGTFLALPVLWIYGIQTDLLFVGDDLFIKETEIIFNKDNRLSYQTSNTSHVKNSNLTADMPTTFDSNTANLTLTKRCLIDDRIRNPFLEYCLFGFLTLGSIVVLFILIIIYGLIALKIRGLKPLPSSIPREIEQTRSSVMKKQVTFIFFLITLAFQFSFIPFVVLTNIRFFMEPDWYNDQSKLGKTLYHFFLRSYLTSCAVNPFIYCISSPQFRKAMFSLQKRLNRDIVCIVCRRTE